MDANVMDADAGAVRTRWWWIRHAPVRDDGGRIYGQSDIGCDCGDSAAFARLAGVVPPGAVWITSNLRRTQETAAAMIAAGAPGPAAIPGPDAHVEPAFAEQNLGQWQGLDRAGFFGSRPLNPASYWFGPADERPPGGESFVDLLERVRPAITRWTQAHAGRDIVAVVHGGTIRSALASALGLPPETALAFAIGNCSITRLDHLAGATGSGWRAAMVNHQP